MPVDRIEAWLRMRDAKRFQKDADDSGRAVRRVGDAAGHVTGQSAGMERATSKAGSALRLLGIGAGLAVGGLGLVAGAAVGAGAAIGVKFNADMEQTATGFAQFLGSTDKARHYLNDLYKISATTPFEFPEVTDAARKFLAFGFSADKTKSILKTVGDTVAGIGGGGPEIDRLTMAFGQMQAKGKASSEELLQMAELGVPALQILKKQLGLTGTELTSKLQKGAISSKDAIAALQKGMNEQFGGAAAKQAKTFNGQLSTMHDNAMLALGVLSEPLFNALKDKVLPAAANITQEISDWAKEGGPARAGKALQAGFKLGAGSATQGFSGFDAIMVSVGNVARTVFPILQQGFRIVSGYVTDFWEALKPAQPFLQNILLPLLKGVAMGILGGVVFAFKVLLTVVRLLAPVLGWLGQKAAPIKPVFEGIGTVIGFIVSGPLLNGIRVFRILFGVMGIVGRIAMRLGGVVLRMLVGTFSRIPGVIGRVIGAISGLGGRVFSAVSGAIGRAYNWIAQQPGKWARAGANLMKAIWNGIRRGVSAATSVAGDIGSAIKNWINNNTPFGDTINAGLFKFHLPALAGGGTIPYGGAAVVGEAGPEIAVARPGGTDIAPISRAGATPQLGGVIHLRSAVTVQVDRKTIGEATADEVADWNARKGRG